MRILVLSILLLAATSNLQCVASSGQSPVDVVRKALLISEDDRAVQPFLSKGLRDDFDHVAAIHNCDFWDANLVTGSQSQTGLKILAARLISETSDAAIVIAKIQKIIEGESVPPKEQTFILLKENGAWKIEEIIIAVEPETMTRDLPFHGTLHAYLHALRARNCQ